jgi:hypothetical protein
MQYDPSTNPLNNNEWSFPVLEIIHIASLAVAVGSIAIVDFRLLGVGLRRMTPAQLLESTDLWTQLGLLVAVMSGIVLLTTDPGNYLRNPAFRFKLGCLVAAIVYNYTLHRKVATSGAGRMWAGFAAFISMVLWLSVVFGGIFYAFI